MKKVPTVIRRRFDEHPLVGFDCGDQPGAKQSFKAECDINNIINNFEKNGVIPAHIRVRDNAIYGDFSDVGSFAEALEIVNHARAQFDALPARVRERFLNDPARFLEFVEDPRNAKELIAMGIGFVDLDADKAAPSSDSPASPADGA